MCGHLNLLSGIREKDPLKKQFGDNAPTSMFNNRNGAVEVMSSSLLERAQVKSGDPYVFLEFSKQKVK